MKSFKPNFLFSVIAGLFMAASVLAQSPDATRSTQTRTQPQTQSFNDTNVNYTFDLPSVSWKITVKPSPISPNVEYVYVDKSDGHMDVRKITIKKGEILSDTIENEEGRLQFLQGYVRGKEETFEGKLKGKVFNYEFVRSSRNMSGRIYFLKADDTTVYAVRFTGERDKLRSIRAETDSIARTFEIKTAKLPVAAN
jgi:hypothetical protein